MKKILTVEGMSCGHCVMHVKTALLEVPGVTTVEVDLAGKSAAVEGPTLDEVMLKAAVDDAGYSVSAVLGVN